MVSGIRYASSQTKNQLPCFETYRRSGPRRPPGRMSTEVGDRQICDVFLDSLRRTAGSDILVTKTIMLDQHNARSDDVDHPGGLRPIVARTETLRRIVTPWPARTEDRSTRVEDARECAVGRCSQA